jgi:hypothetical protein
MKTLLKPTKNQFDIGVGWKNHSAPNFLRFLSIKAIFYITKENTYAE